MEEQLSVQYYPGQEPEQNSGDTVAVMKIIINYIYGSLGARWAAH